MAYRSPSAMRHRRPRIHLLFSMQTAPAAHLPPLETLSFCYWLLGAEDGEGIDPTAPSRWLPLLREEAQDGFAQLERTLRREAALLAERSMPLWDQVGRADPLSKAVGRAARKLATVVAAVPAGSDEAQQLEELPAQLIHELVAGY